MAVFVVATMTLFIHRAEAVITTPFDVTFSANANGSIVLRGYANLTCPASATGWPDALNGVGSASGEALNNNGYTMVNLDSDADSGTFNSRWARWPARACSPC